MCKFFLRLAQILIQKCFQFHVFVQFQPSATFFVLDVWSIFLKKYEKYQEKLENAKLFTSIRSTSVFRQSFYWPSPMFRSRHPSSSLVFIRSKTNDSIGVQIRSDWSMRETIVSGVSSAPTAWSTATLATPHFMQKKSACSTLSTGTVGPLI